MPARLTVLEESASASEWRIGYVDNIPAVGDAEGRWYRAPEDAVVPHASSQLVWMAQQGEWTCVHQRHWDASQVPASPADTWLQQGPIYTEQPE